MALYPPAIKKLIAPGANDPRVDPDTLVLHVAVSTADSLHDYFDGPSGGIESNFYVRFDGTVEQYRDTSFQADAQTGRGADAISVETEGIGEGTWTAAQLASIKALILWAHKEHPKISLAKCTSPAGPGVGYHALFDEWNRSRHSCPGPARIKQFEALLVPWLAEAAKPVKLVSRPRARVAAVNMHAPGTDDSVRMDRAVAQFNHLGFTIVGLSEFNAPMNAEIDPRPYWMVHRAQPNTGSSGNAVAWKSAVWTCLEAGVLPVEITGRTLHMAGVVLKHRRTGLLLPVLAIHNPPRAGKAAMPQVDRDTCLEAEQAWVEQKTKECGRALILGDFNQPDSFIKTLARGVGHNVDEIYGSGRVRFSGPKVHDGFVPNVTDHRAVSVLINVER